MSRYVVILIVPLVVGSLIAVAILLINGLRERRERKDMELREARRLIDVCVSNRHPMSRAIFSGHATPGKPRGAGATATARD